MATATSTLEIVLQARDEASAKIRNISSSLQQHSAQLKKTGFAMTAAGTAGAFAIIKLTGAAGKATGIQSAFTSFFGEAGPKALEEMRKATRGSVSEVDLMTAANQAMLLGIDPEALPEMFKGAFAAASATGRPVAAAINDITTGIGRQSKLILDNLGIIVNAGAANEKYAESLGKATSELTEQEKKAAFTAATMEALRINTERIGVVTDNAAIAAQRLRAGFTNASIAIGTAMAPAVIFIADKLGGLVKIFTNLSPATKKIIGGIVLLTTGFLLIAGPILLFLGFLPGIIAGFGLIATFAGVAWLAITGPIGAVVIAIGLLVAAGVILVTNWELVKVNAMAIWSSITTFITGEFNNMLEIIKVVLTAISDLWKLTWTIASDFLKTTLDTIINVVNAVFTLIAEFIGGKLNAIRDTWVSTWEFIRNFFSGISDTISSSVEGLIDRILEKFVAVKTRSSPSSILLQRPFARREGQSAGEYDAQGAARRGELWEP